MTRPEPLPAPGGRHTGVVSRAPLARPNRSDPRRDWLALVIVGGLAVIILIVISGVFGGSATATLPTPSPMIAVVYGGPTPSQAPTASLLPPFSFEPTTPPTPTFSPTPRLTLPPTPTPTPTPTPSPSPSPTPTPSPSPTPTPTLPPTSPALTSDGPLGAEPTIPPVGLLIVDPIDRSATIERVVIVRGLAAPGATITREIPMWFDEHTVADNAGRWSFVLQLAIGDNTFTFRVDDDITTSRTLNVHCFVV